MQPARSERHLKVTVPLPCQNVASRVEIYHREASVGIGSGHGYMGGLNVERLEPQLDLAQWLACGGVDHCPRKRTLFGGFVLQRKEKRENQKWRHAVLQQYASNRLTLWNCVAPARGQSANSTRRTTSESRP